LPLKFPLAGRCRLIVKRTRVKICGITRPEDARVAVSAGADAIGLVFYPPSPRAISIEQALLICQQLPPFVTVVALTVNAGAASVQAIIDALPGCLLQFHGDEPVEFCESFSRPYIKALAMKDGVDLHVELNRFASAQALLVDAYKPGTPGGTGEIFDWNLIPLPLRQRIILAGGLTPGNIESALSTVHPFAVDVSSGVEISPGIKDPGKVGQFIGSVKRADNVEY